MEGASKAEVFKPQRISERVNVVRVIDQQNMPQLDPFIFLDYFRDRLPNGFPDHPHRGFQTVMYTISGTLYHEDFKGNKGKLETGEVQWLTAGRGIVHSTIPGSRDEETVGFQLWINLHSKNKMVEPEYQEFKSDVIPTVEKDGLRIKVISGECEKLKGPIVNRTPTLYLDVHLQNNVVFSQTIPKGWPSFIFVIDGTIIYNGDVEVGKDHTCILDRYAQTHLFKSHKARFILLAGQPLNEPVARRGPMVMNTEEELDQAFDDLKQGKNGFEGALGWKSKVQLLKEEGYTPSQLGF